VRNLDDGSVEALAEGSASALDAFAAWCAEGPPAARVDGLERSDAPATGELSGFAVEPRR
jgi:acylphosphatase